ncbi:MAG: sensor histidine kinase, partial [Intestinibacter sp.]
MRFTDYLKDKILIILLNISALFFLDIFLILVNNSVNTIVIISFVWICVFALYIFVEYYRRNKFFKKIDDTLDKLDKKYLIAELMENSYRLEDKKYKNIIRKSNKSVIERINQLEDEQKDYKDYIESWVHEIKLPITTMELICENNRNEVTRKLQAELSRIDNFVEIILYYARLDKVYKDYIIKEIDLSEVVYETISKNKTYFIQNKMMIDVNCS